MLEYMYTGFMRSGKVRKSQDLGVPKSGQTTILIKIRNSQENECQSQEKVRIFVFFCNMEVDFGQKWINIYSSYSFQSSQ